MRRIAIVYRTNPPGNSNCRQTGKVIVAIHLTSLPTVTDQEKYRSLLNAVATTDDLMGLDLREFRNLPAQERDRLAPLR